MDFPLSKELKADLKKRQKQTKDKKEYTKISVLLFLDLKLNLETIAKGLGIDIATVSRQGDRYKKSSVIEEYLMFKYHQNVFTKLSKEEIEKLKKHLDNHLYSTCEGIVNYIEKTFSKSYTPNGLCLLLKRLGYVHKQTKIVPGKADPLEQKKFERKLKKLKNLMKNSSKLYFVDGVHPTHNVLSTRVWTRKSEERKVKSNTGRQRLNINGAMNGVNPTDIIYREDKRLNRRTTARLFLKILKENKEKKRIYLVCDNARYYRSKLIKKLLKKHEKLRIIYLPPYSPNLNLIERLWRLMRKEKLSTHYYESFDDFKKSLLDFFDNIEDVKDKLDSLMTWNFHFPSN